MTRWLAVALAAVMALGGCQTEKSAVAAGPVKIGVILPIGGSRSATGADLQAGVELALDIVNGEHDLDLPLAAGQGLTRHGGVRLTAVYRDSYADPVRAAASVEELVLQERVKALLGGFTAQEAAAISEQAEVIRIPLVNSTASAPRLSQRGFQWFFRLAPDDTYSVQTFFQLLGYIQENHPGAVPRRLAVIFENGLWGTGVAKLVKRLAQKNGFELVAEIPYNANDLSLHHLVAANSRSLKPNMLIVQASFDRDAMLLLQALESQDLLPRAILTMNSGWLHASLVKTLGTVGERVLTQREWAEDVSLRQPLAAAVNNLFRQRYGRDLSGNAARTFTAILVLADALNRAANFTPQAVREALLNTDIPGGQLILPWEGIRFDPRTGQNIFTGGFIGQFQEGDYRTIWPRHTNNNQIYWPVAKNSGQEAQP